MADPYLYKNSGVLKNKFGIKDKVSLDKAEANYVSLRLRELAQRPLSGAYDVDHFLSFHHYIFQDVYEWAGEVRRINIEKEEDALGGLSVEYSDIWDIAKDLDRALGEMREREWSNMSINEKTVFFSADVAAIWKVHCFREGNTRTTLTFCCQFADEQGININRELFENNSAYVRTALVAYNAVFHDLGDLSKKEYLERIIRASLKGE